MIMGRVFNPDELHAIAKSVTGISDRQAACEQIVDELKSRHPQHIRDDIPWLFSNARGTMAQLKILHCSMTEYLILFGTPIGTQGHSGRFLAQIWDFVFDGEMWSYEEGELQRKVIEPGAVAYLGRGRAKGWAVPEAAYMLEYARGPIPTMTPYIVWGALFSTLDMSTLASTFWYATKLTVKELLRGKI